MPNILRGPVLASPFVLEDIESRAREILEDARRKAQAEAQMILSQARAEAERIRAEAELQGRTSGASAGESEGRAKGESEGRADALAKIAPAWETARLVIEEAARRVESSVAEVTAQADEKVLQLAWRIGQILLKKEMAADAGAFRGNLQAALKAAARTGRFRVRLNPEDLATLETGFDEFKSFLPSNEAFEWVGDESVGKGGVVVETASGDVDATIATQIAQIEQAVLGRAGGKR